MHSAVIMGKSRYANLIVWIVTSLIVMYVITAGKEPVKETQVKNQYVAETDWNHHDNMSDLTPDQMMSYLRWSNGSSCKLFHDFGGIIVDRSSLVAIDGQKSVCLDAGIAPPRKKCVVYSFGINNEWSFDDMMDKYGCQIFAFDPSMNVADHNRTANIHFFRMGLANSDQNADSHGWKVKTLDSFYNMLKAYHGNADIDYLKIDIEWAEWDIIPQIISSGMLDRVRQMGMEIHLGTNDNFNEQKRRMQIIRSIENAGMIRFASKVNPWTLEPFPPMGISGYFAHELAWYNKRFAH